MIPDKKFFEKDKFAKYIGINIDEFTPGYARVSLNIDKKHLNGIDIVHGGALFTLADYALAIASNAHGKVAVSINVSITYIKSSSGGRITAIAKEVSAGSKISTYRIEIIDEHSNKLAVAQGTVYIKNSAISL